MRRPRGGTVVHEHALSADCPASSPRLGQQGYQASLNTQERPGLRKDLLPHPCLWQYMGVVWRKGCLRSSGILTSNATCSFINRTEQEDKKWLPLSLVFSSKAPDSCCSITNRQSLFI